MAIDFSNAESYRDSLQSLIQDTIRDAIFEVEESEDLVDKKLDVNCFERFVFGGFSYTELGVTSEVALDLLEDVECSLEHNADIDVLNCKFSVVLPTFEQVLSSQMGEALREFVEVSLKAYVVEQLRQKVRESLSKIYLEDWNLISIEAFDFAKDFVLKTNPSHTVKEIDAFIEASPKLDLQGSIVCEIETLDTTTDPSQLELDVNVYYPDFSIRSYRKLSGEVRQDALEKVKSAVIEVLQKTLNSVKEPLTVNKPSTHALPTTHLPLKSKNTTLIWGGSVVAAVLVGSWLHRKYTKG